MKLLILGWSNSAKHALIAKLLESELNSFELAVFDENKEVEVLFSQNTQLLEQIEESMDDIMLLDKHIEKADIITLFLPEKITEQVNLDAVLKSSTAILDLALYHQIKKMVLVSEGQMRVESLTDNNSREWRPTSQHSNWIRLQYLLLQEVSRTRVEGLNSSVVWYVPPKEEHEPALKSDEIAYQLALPQSNLIDFLVQLLNKKAVLQEQYFLSGSPQRVYRSKEKSSLSFLQRLGLLKRKNTPTDQWNLIQRGGYTFNDFENVMKRKPNP